MLVKIILNENDSLLFIYIKKDTEVVLVITAFANQRNTPPQSTMQLNILIATRWQTLQRVLIYMGPRLKSFCNYCLSPPPPSPPFSLVLYFVSVFVTVR